MDFCGQEMMSMWVINVMSADLSMKALKFQPEM